MMGKTEGIFAALVVWSVSAMLWLKTCSVRVACNHSVFMGKCPTVIGLIHPEDVGSIQDFILLHLWLLWIKRNGRQGESKITNINGGKLFCRPPSSYRKLLDRVAFWIVYIAWRVGYKTGAYNNATSVGVGRWNKLSCVWMCSRDFFCVCVAETVFSWLLSTLLCILLS